MFWIVNVGLVFSTDQNGNEKVFEHGIWNSAWFLVKDIYTVTVCVKLETWCSHFQWTYAKSLKKIQTLWQMMSSWRLDSGSMSECFLPLSTENHRMGRVVNLDTLLVEPKRKPNLVVAWVLFGVFMVPSSPWMKHVNPLMKFLLAVKVLREWNALVVWHNKEICSWDSGFSMLNETHQLLVNFNTHQYGDLSLWDPFSVDFGICGSVVIICLT